jgi:ABC-type sugar transport system permease subunit
MNATPLSDWFDRQAGRVFILPAVLVILAFSIFPTLISAWLALTRFSLEAGGYKLSFIGMLNFKKLFYGSQQFHLIGTPAPISTFGGLVLVGMSTLLAFCFRRSWDDARRGRAWAAGVAMAAVTLLAAALLTPIGPLSDAQILLAPLGPNVWWILFIGLLVGFAGAGLVLRRLVARGPRLIGLVGRFLAGTILLVTVLLYVATIGDKGQFGSVMTTLVYVICGLTLQFAIGLGLALLCAQQIKGRAFFRMTFFMPLMVTPVGIAYTFRMLADSTVGPFQPLFTFLGFGPVEWATHAWSARLVVMCGDSWQWIPFIFIVLLAAVEGQPRDQVEAAQLDGASGWQIFRDITWPSIAPVAATVVLIRLIEAFKMVDLPNVLTNGGPGIATESLTLHAFIQWRALDLGSSAAVAYMLLFVSTIAAVSFFNFVVRPARGEVTA